MYKVTKKHLDTYIRYVRIVRPNEFVIDKDYWSPFTPHTMNQTRCGRNVLFSQPVQDRVWRVNGENVHIIFSFIDNLRKSFLNDVII